MSLQPAARWPGSKHGFLAGPKHGLARYCKDPGRPGTVYRAVPGLHHRHTERHGTARLLVAGPVAAR